jgi:hypothetical protein
MPSINLGGIFCITLVPRKIFARHYEGPLKSLELFYDPDITRAFKKSLEFITAIEVCQVPFTIPAFLGGDYEVVPIPPSITTYKTFKPFSLVFYIFLYVLIIN